MSDKIKELAKELCTCHHKCKDTDKCVVEDEALLLISEDDSNNFDVKSNNELVPKENELPLVLTNEEKVSVKDKQIEEMASMLCGQIKSCTECILHKPCLMMNCATILYHAGYRKQSVGEWEQYGLRNPQCSLCHKYNIEKSNYCSHCGAKMKGGEE